MPSAMNTQTRPLRSDVIESYPAYDIHAPIEDFRGRAAIQPGEYIMLPFESRSHGRQWHEFKVGSVMGYAMDNNECPIEAFNRAKDRGHAVYFLSPCGTSLTAHKEAKRFYQGYEFGSVVHFMGKDFRIEPDHNQNAKFVEVTE